MILWNIKCFSTTKFSANSTTSNKTLQQSFLIPVQKIAWGRNFHLLPHFQFQKAQPNTRASERTFIRACFYLGGKTDTCPVAFGGLVATCMACLCSDQIIDKTATFLTFRNTSIIMVELAYTSNFQLEKTLRANFQPIGPVPTGPDVPLVPPSRRPCLILNCIWLPTQLSCWGHNQHFTNGQYANTGAAQNLHCIHKNSTCSKITKPFPMAFCHV